MVQEGTLDSPAASEEERELGSKPIAKLFFKYMMTTMIGMGAQAIMVILEGIIIGNGLGQFGLAVVGIIMPLELLNLALGAALSMGIATVAGNRLGAGDLEGARTSFSQGFWLSAYIVIAVAAVLFIFAPQVAVFLGATEELMDGSVLFIRIFLGFYPFCILGQMLGGVLRVDEKPGLSSAVMFASAGIAVVWLYVSVMVLQIGIAGAAVYYGLSIGLWFLCVFYFLFNKQTIFKIRVSDMKIEGALAKNILSIGLPSFLVQIGSFIYTIVINNELGALGADMSELQIAAFSLLNGYIVYIINMMWQCAQYGMQPVAAYNYGAGNYGRLKQLVKVGLAGTAGICALVAVAFIVFAVPVCSVFAGDAPDLIALAAQYTLPLCMFACFGSLANVMSTYFQAVDKVGLSIVMGVSRYIFFTVPLIFIMSAVMGITGVWWAQPVADACTFAFVMVFVVRELKRLTALENKGAAVNASGTAAEAVRA